ncbi:SusC/RagA family TonB-linked outer membrane protein [Mucilaginibacter sp. FT3.2]|uniref:SusC/RagA family TonB-linked outer membrane protein n=1 Tax=Mucilaginibacter sp. FT3.2 TaxID=2723090 RepID=UPI00160D03F1|nr:TonB-dependent receptor [Mucilaginibacter sp. FT3.2]MBB6229811.1 TonB-linked SusC/RagA family outer membrane protein [Mucilaginibacter sp. FT3.2]
MQKFTQQINSICKVFMCVLLMNTCITKGAYASGLTSEKMLQKVLVTGVVKAQNGDLMPGVYVQEKGTNNGTVTDINGKYQITVDDKATLTYKMLGFATAEVQVTGKTTINVELVTDQKSLNEVMVVGYGSKNKSTFAGSAVTLNAEDLNKASLSVANLLQGRAAGVQVQQNNGTPGASLSIRIRGTNSINADSEPLYVIDGFPTNNGIGFTINPEDIASISILKDAASTAIYGARGANGVVLITTKNGKNKRSNLSIVSTLGYQRVVDRFNLAGPYDFAVRLNALFVAQGTTAPYKQSRLDSLKNGLIGTDWQSQLFRTARVQNHTISFSGGNSNTSVYSSFDYLDQQGVVIDSRYRRVGGRVNIDHAVSDKFKMTARVFGNYGIQNDLPLAPSSINGFVKQVIKANPASTFDSGVSAQLDAQNPLHFIAATDRQNSVFRTNGYFSLKYEPIKNLVFQSDLGADINQSKVLYFAPSTVPAGVASKGLGTITDIAESDLIFNPTANYSIRKSGNNVKLLVGYNQQQYIYNESGTIATNFSSDDLGVNNLGIAQTFSAYSGKSQIKRRSWFGRLDYDYQNKYIFTGTYRIDGSSVFGDNHKLGYFPSAALAWRFNEETFVKDLNIFSSGKARASYGITGNDRVSSGISLATFAGDNTTKYTFDGVSTVSGIAVTKLSNPDLKWEQTNALDLGLDFGFFGDRIILEADYYNKQTHDLLLNRSIAPSTGFITQFGNAGKVENKGWEFSLQTVNVSSKGFKWNSTFTFAYNKNKVLSLGANNSDIYVGSIKPDGAADFETPFIIRVGQPIGAIYGYVYQGIVQQNDPVLKTTQPNSAPGDPKYADLNGDGIVNALDRKVLGTGVPKMFFGFTNNITYKNFQLDIVTQGQAGGKLLNVQKEDMLNPISQGNTLKQVITDTWSPTNTSGTIPANGFYGTPHGGWVNSRFVESSNYIRIKNITLGYNFPPTLLKSIGVAQLNIYLNAQNLFTFTKYTGLDPEVGNLIDNSQQNQNAGRGIDFNAYPVNKMFLVGLRVTF